MQPDLAVDHVKHSTTTELERPAGRFVVAISSDESGVSLPFEHAPVMMLALNERVRLLLPGRKRGEQRIEMFGNRFLTFEKLAPGVKQLALRRIECRHFFRVVRIDRRHPGPDHVGNIWHKEERLGVIAPAKQMRRNSLKDRGESGQAKLASNPRSRSA